MAPGDKKTVVIPAADAFGEYDKERVFTVPRCDFPDDLDPAVDDELVLANEDEEELGVTVIEANAGKRHLRRQSSPGRRESHLRSVAAGDTVIPISNQG